MRMYQRQLFYDHETYPSGFIYVPEFISPAGEKRLLRLCKTIDFIPYVYRGYEAKRRTKSYSKNQNGYPHFLIPIIERASEHFGIHRERIEHAMVTEYAPGTPIGWHRDMPPYDKIIGISLGSAVPFRFRRKMRGGWERVTVTAEPRSLYCMSGPSRYVWQHSIPPVHAWRYSITLRTVRR